MPRPTASYRPVISRPAISYRPSYIPRPSFGGGYRPSYGGFGGFGGFGGGRRYYAVADNSNTMNSQQPTQNSNSSLIIGLSVGGALLVVLVVVVIVLVSRKPVLASPKAPKVEERV